MSAPVIIIGGGNMGGALAMRWHGAKIAPVHVVEHNPARVAVLRACGIMVHTKLENAPAHAAAVVLAIKPQQFSDIKPALANTPATRQLLVSIMAGVSLASLAECSPRAVRVMPNLPVMVGAGMSVACAPALDVALRKYVSTLFDAVGSCRWVDTEDQLQAATAISGSGPGYVFAFMEALEKAAISHGLDAATARQLVGQTVRGAGQLASESPESFTTLREQVTSPGGTTHAALEVFRQSGQETMVAQAVAAAIARAGELGSA